MNPWSGNRLFVMKTKPIKSKVVSKTIRDITPAIFIFWIMVTTRKTTARARSKFCMATARI